MMLHIVVQTVNQYLNGADLGRNIVFGRYYRMMAMGAGKFTCDGAKFAHSNDCACSKASSPLAL